MKTALFLLILSVPAIAMQKIDQRSIVAPSKLGNIELVHDDNGIYYLKEGKPQIIERHQCDQQLRKLLAAKKLKEFTDHGYIKVNTMGQENDMLALSARVRGPGGGPWLSAAVFLGVEVIGFTALLTGAMVANTVAPGAGGVATAIALGSGGIPAAVTAIQMKALSASTWAFALPTP